MCITSLASGTGAFIISFDDRLILAFIRARSSFIGNGFVT